tara:strand:+ start:141 stop:707 length:567 start_codon:yes stop_codon:yes gene_type:complete
MENWNTYVKESADQPKTWGELSQNIVLNRAASKWPRIGKTLLKFGFKVATAKAKLAMDAIQGIEDVLDFVPDELEAELTAGKEKAVEKLSTLAKQRGGAIGAFIVDDLMAMDDSLTTNLPGYEELNLEDEYENLVDKEKLKRWAKGIMGYASSASPDEPLPDLNKKLEDDLQDATGAHPDVDKPDIRK